MDRLAQRSLVVIAVLLSFASSAFAGTPLPDPPFSGGGFLPPSTDVLKQEESVGKLVSKYLHQRGTCDRAAVNSLQLAYTPTNAAKVAQVQQKWTSCVQKVEANYVKSRDRILSKGTPPCLDQSGIDAQRGATDALIAVLAPVVYCDGDGASPDPVTGLDIPDKKQETIGENEVAKLVVKSNLAATKCYAKAASYALRFGGILDERSLAKIEACLAKVSSKAQDAVTDLDQTNKLPDCLPAATAVDAAADAATFATVSTSAIYCASPSGAFVDGPSTM